MKTSELIKQLQTIMQEIGGDPEVAISDYNNAVFYEGDWIVAPYVLKSGELEAKIIVGRECRLIIENT